MKFIASTFGTLAVIGAVMAQTPSDLPDCGQTCINNLLGQAPAFGCTAGGDGEAACLCGNASFTYGIRDCSNEACTDANDAASVINYGIAYCSSAGVAIPTTIQTVTSGTIVPSTTGGAGSASSETGSAITTSSFVSTLTSDGTTLTSSGATTIFSGAAGSVTSGAGSVTSSAGSAASSAGSAASSASGSVSSALSSVSNSVSSAISSLSSGASSAASSATATGSDTAASSAFAPRMTAAPVGFLAAAGVAAMFL